MSAAMHPTASLQQGAAALHDLLLKLDAAALHDLLLKLDALSNESYETAFAEEDATFDPHDYPALVAMVEHSIAAALNHADGGQRAGYFRALTDLFFMALDALDMEADWDPIRRTAPAYAAQAAVQELGARHA